MLTVNEQMRLPIDKLAQLMQSKDWDQLRERTRDPLRYLSVCDFMLKMEISSPSAAKANHAFGTLPQAMLNLLSSVIDQKSDPVAIQLASCDMPYAWDIEQLCSATGNHVYLLLRTKGIYRALSLTMRTENAVSRIDFFGNMPDVFVCAGAGLADALLLGMYLHQATERLWRKTTPAPPALLSPREVECLGWSAAGKTSQETGVILGISHRTVYFHLKNVASKLDVYSTRHAVSRAISMGIIKAGR